MGKWKLIVNECVNEWTNQVYTKRPEGTGNGRMKGVYTWNEWATFCTILWQVIDKLGGWSLLDTKHLSSSSEEVLYDKKKSVIHEAAAPSLIKQVIVDTIKKRANADNRIHQVAEEVNLPAVPDQHHQFDDHADERRLSEEKSDDDNWMDVLVASHNLAFEPLFGMWVGVDDKDSDSHIIAVCKHQS